MNFSQRQEIQTFSTPFSNYFSYKAPRCFFKHIFEKISRRSADSIIPAPKDIEKERKKKIKM